MGKSLWTAVALFLMMASAVQAQETKKENVAETLRQMLERQNRVIELMQQIMETRLPEWKP